MSSSDMQRPLVGDANADSDNAELKKLNEALSKQRYIAGFHGDALIGDKVAPKVGIKDDLGKIMELKNVPSITAVLANYLKGNGLDIKAGASLIASMSNNSVARSEFIEEQVKIKYDRMLHPPLSYLGDAFKYRTADGKFNSAMNPHLGQAGAPYAKTVPAKTHPLGALPDPGDLFDRLMAREENGRPSQSGLSSMLVYHATIIIHDIFRTNDNDKSISDTSSYLDLSPLYGFTDEMQRKVRDDKYGLGLLKPDTFAEDRLLRQPPGVCIMLVMYNRYHNYAATQLRRINENGRFSVPRKYREVKLLAAATYFVGNSMKDRPEYQDALEKFKHANQIFENHGRDLPEDLEKEYKAAWNALEAFIYEAQTDREQVKAFYDGYDAAWKKLDDDLFHTARLITCGIYIQVSIHDYLRALMGFHQYDTNFTLDPRVNQSKAKDVSRGLGNQVTVEFNLLYRFHCAISLGDEDYLEKYLEEYFEKKSQPDWNPKEMGLQEFLMEMAQARERTKNDPVVEPCNIEFGLKNKEGDKAKEKMAFKRDPITKLFSDEQMIEHLNKVMDEPISNFGPRNVPRSLKAVEVMGILQARKWGVGTLNDFREFFGMKRHETFESISGCVEVQNALRDLYEHPDKVELYPGIFCESDASQNADPGPSDVDSALWAAIFSDAITLVRSDRFYTVDWNTNSLTSWGMKEVTPDNDVLKSSVFHRLLQRSFPEWFPSTSVRFFHPFYTAQKNAEYAAAQGYSQDFAIKPTGEKATFDTSASNPRKPLEPKILTDPEQIMKVLDDTTDIIVHPVRLEPEILPPKVAEVLAPRELPKNGSDQGGTNDGKKSGGEHHESIDSDTDELMTYFTTLMRDIIRRESVVMKPGQENPKTDPVYQLDVTRDFAIPVVTRYVADFLGFGHLVKSENNLDAKYSENEIYQHISNCHLYFSYNADETKLPKRRKVFKDSMKFLFDLTLNEGNVAEANKFRLTRALQSVGSWFWKSAAGDKNPMSELGFKVSEQVLQQQKGDAGKAAAILLLIALDSSYNSVLAFTSVLNSFITGLYTMAAEKQKSGVTAEKSCDWRDVQRLALKEFSDVPTDTFNDIKKIVLKEQRKSVKLPILRKARMTCTMKGPNLAVEKDQLIICDIHRGDRKHKDDFSATGVPPPWETKYLSYHTSFTERLTDYHPRHLAANSLTAMIKVLAQLKDLRRGHDTQGHLKKIALDSSSATYSNFMAPQRIRHINNRVRAEIAAAEPKVADKLRKAYNLDRLRCPATDTYMTPEWDEMIPFPTTWKVRFNGFGESTYGGDTLPLLKSMKVPDDFPPFYELPGGPSHTGGSFGEPVYPYPAKQQEYLATRKKQEEQVPIPNGDSGSDAGDSAIGMDDGRQKEMPKGVTNGCGIGI